MRCRSLAWSVAGIFPNVLDQQLSSEPGPGFYVRTYRQASSLPPLLAEKCLKFLQNSSNAERDTAFFLGFVLSASFIACTLMKAALYATAKGRV